MTGILVTLFAPLLGALGLLFIGKEYAKGIKWSALGVSLTALVFSIFPLLSFDTSNGGYQFVVNVPWIASIDAGFRIGVDGMSLLLIVLTTVIMPISIFSSFESIHKREKEYYIMMLLLQFGMTGVFLAMDTFLFYVFWEIILIPMYFIIGIWGGKERIYAAIKFFLYTVVGSLLMLVAIVWLGLLAAKSPSIGHFTTDLVAIRSISSSIPLDIQLWLFGAFALSFCIKVPLFPLHTWLPDAHVQAPTAGSVVLAGVLLKMGTYGLVRFNLDLFPQASSYFAPLISWLAVIGIVYGALVAMVQTDVKKLVAYSSVSHLGFVVLGIFSMTPEGLQGAIIQMVNHGLSTGMLFLCVGVLYERRHTREISDFGGITKVMPHFAVFFGIAMFASVGLPGLNGFVGEFLTLLGAFQSPFLHNWAFAIIGASGVIFAAVYLLWMFQRVMFGPIIHQENVGLKDVTTAERWTLVPLTALIILLGVYPKSAMQFSENSTRALVHKLEMTNLKVSQFAAPIQTTSSTVTKKRPTHD